MIEDLDKEQLETNIANYKRLKVTVGGKYSLAECYLEMERRKGIAYSGHDVALAIVEIAKTSDDGYCTFLEMWKNFNPKREWVGAGCMQEANNMLGAAAYFCASFPKGALPIVTALVVRTDSRTVTSAAKKNMWKAANDWGVKSANETADIDAWYEAQLVGARKLTKEDLVR